MSIKKEISFNIPTSEAESKTSTENENLVVQREKTKSPPPNSPNGKYTNWSTQHTILVDQPWCCIGDLIAFCDKYEYKPLSVRDSTTHGRIICEVKALLAGKAPFDLRKRFPSDTRNTENLWVCIGRCVGVEYHLNRILSALRKPLDKLSADKQRMARQNFHLAVNELRLDISARITDVRLYDRAVFEKHFHLEWQDTVA